MSQARVIKYSQFIRECLEQSETREGIVFICPACKTLQSGADMMAARGVKTFDEVQGRIGYACIGRYRTDKGCTFKMGRGRSSNTALVVIDNSGVEHPHFELASIKQADAYRTKALEVLA